MQGKPFVCCLIDLAETDTTTLSFGIYIIHIIYISLPMYIYSFCYRFGTHMVC